MKINTLYKSNEKITFENYLNKCGVNDIDEFLEPSGKYLDDYNNYNRMKEAVNTFNEVYYNGFGEDTTVYILCDSGDCDGITSTVIMYQYMKCIYSNWDIEILLHTGKQRGLQDEELLSKCIDNPRDLLIIPDSGTNDLEQVNKLTTKTNTKVIVLDHHNFNTPIKRGVLVNNQDPLSNVSKNGSGCLVTFNFIQALNEIYDCCDTSYFIDMVALSLVSDSMEMSDQQNRTFYHYGLETIDCINNLFLKKIFEKFIGNKEYTQKDISFKIIPKINSICRSKDQKLKEKIISAFIGYGDIEEVLDLCAESHKNQIKIVDDVISANISKIKTFTDNQLNILSCDDMPRSYSGLVAGKIMNMCDNKPTIVGKIINGELIGSLRSPIPLQEELEKNDLVEWCQGHSESAGICIKEKNIKSLIDYYNTLKLDYTPHIDVLQSYMANSIPMNLFNEFGANTNVLWGKGISTPQIHVKLEYIPCDIMIMGKSGTTLKLTQYGIDYIFFFVNKENKVDLGLGYFKDNEYIDDPFINGVRVLDIVGTVGINEFRGIRKPQIIVDKFEITKKKIITPNSLFKC